MVRAHGLTGVPVRVDYAQHGHQIPSWRLPGEQRNRQLSEETFADVVRLLNPKLPMVRGRRADARRRAYTRTRPRCPPASWPRKRTGQKTGTAPRANFTTAITFAPP